MCPAEGLLFRTGTLLYSRSSCLKWSVGCILSSLGRWLTVLEIHFSAAENVVIMSENKYQRMFCMCVLSVQAAVIFAHV